MKILLVHCHYRLPGGEDAVFAAERELLERHGHTVLVYERSNEEAAHGAAKALLPLLVPLFVSAFRRADELAVAMECRCYHGDEGRTRMKQLTWCTRDTLAMLWSALVLAGVIVLARFGL